MIRNLANISQVLEKQLHERLKQAKMLKMRLKLHKLHRIFTHKFKLTFSLWRASKLNEKKDALLLEYISFLEEQVRESDESRGELVTP
jgi:hypothetical protein